MGATRTEFEIYTMTTLGPRLADLGFASDEATPLVFERPGNGWSARLFVENFTLAQWTCSIVVPELGRYPGIRSTAVEGLRLELRDPSWAFPGAVHNAEVPLHVSMLTRISDEALPWFEQFSDLESVADTLFRENRLDGIDLDVYVGEVAERARAMLCYGGLQGLLGDPEAPALWHEQARRLLHEARRHLLVGEPRTPHGYALYDRDPLRHGLPAWDPKNGFAAMRIIETLLEIEQDLW